MFKKIEFKASYFILFYTVLNIIQAYFTELTSDEAYYWFYSLKLDWGYYDHPPMVAVLTYLGSFFSDTELGVRLFHIITLSLGLHFLLKLIPEKEKVYAAIIILALPLFNYISIIIFPDTALVASTVGILYAYRNFLNKNDLKSAILLGFFSALALYCKYHAILFMFFIVLSNIKLLKNKYLYISILTITLLFLPHLIWQYNHDFSTFKYHLIGRSSGFKTKYFTEYLGTQIGVIGLGLFFIPFVFKPTNHFEKSLKYIGIGSLLFFAFSSLKGYVHLHWTSIALIPIIIMGAKFYSNKKTNKLFNSLLLPFIFFIVIIRVYLMTNIFGVNNLNVDYYHEHPLWAEDISNIADESTVVFNTGNSSLRDAPMYTFYAKKPAVALFPGEKKKSQYQILKFEDSIQNKEITYLTGKTNKSTEVVSRMGKKFNYQKIDNFVSFTNIHVVSDYKPEISTNDSLLIKATIINHRNIPLHFTNEQLYIQFRDAEDRIKQKNIPLKLTNNIPENSEKTLVYKIEPDYLTPGNYSFIIGFTTSIPNLTSVNSDRKELVIK
jgi:hypothetical protein